MECEFQNATYVKCRTPLPPIPYKGEVVDWNGHFDKAKTALSGLGMADISVVKYSPTMIRERILQNEESVKTKY